MTTVNKTNNTPSDIIKRWVDIFNQGDASTLAEFYTTDAINHQVANEPVIGKKAIYEMFKEEFAQAEMVCIIENIFEDGNVAILEWKDPIGLRGCGFFHFNDGRSLKKIFTWVILSFSQIFSLIFVG